MSRYKRYILTDDSAIEHKFENGKLLCDLYSDDKANWKVFDKKNQQSMLYSEFMTMRKLNLSRRGRKYKNDTIRGVIVNAKMTKERAYLLEKTLKKNNMSLGDFLDMVTPNIDNIIRS